MKIVHIKDKLAELGVDWRTINLGVFDDLGEVTAKKRRDPSHPLFKSAGSHFRPSYERGILLYYLIRKLRASSLLEIGFGRGFSSLCAAMAFHDMGVCGRIASIDVNFDQIFLKMLQQVFPADWFKMLELYQGLSTQAIPQVKGEFDIALIDGDHSKLGTMSDWSLVKDRTRAAIVFDDYHLPSKQDAGIQCRDAIDEIDFEKEGFQQPELIILDRRLYVDDRRCSDAEIDYGQVVALKQGISFNDEGDW